MAVLYKEKRGDLHIYRNRMPHADGGDPLLGWTWVSGSMGCLWLLVLLGLFGSGMYAQKQALLYTGIVFLVIAAIQVTWPFQRVVLSPRTQQVYLAVFFIKWGKRPFKDIAEIVLSDQEVRGKMSFMYTARLRDEFAAPLRLSPRAKSMAHLSLYYHEIIPIAEELLAPFLAHGPASAEEDVEALEVAVETVEVPLAEAATILSGSTKIGPVGPQKRETASRAKPVSKGNAFQQRESEYCKSLWLANGLLFSASIILATAVNVLVIWLAPGSIVTVVCLTGIVLNALYQLYHFSQENMNFSIDPTEQVFRFWTLFGLKKREYGFSKMGLFTMKSMFGLHSLCLEIKGHAVDPTLLVSTSPRKIREAYLEACAIMGIDSRKYWKP